MLNIEFVIDTITEEDGSQKAVNMAKLLDYPYLPLVEVLCDKVLEEGGNPIQYIHVPDMYIGELPESDLFSYIVTDHETAHNLVTDGYADCVIGENDLFTGNMVNTPIFIIDRVVGKKIRFDYLKYREDKIFKYGLSIPSDRGETIIGSTFELATVETLFSNKNDAYALLEILKPTYREVVTDYNNFLSLSEEEKKSVGDDRLWVSTCKSLPVYRKLLSYASRHPECKNVLDLIEVKSISVKK